MADGDADSDEDKLIEDLEKKMVIDQKEKKEENAQLDSMLDDLMKDF